MSRPSFITNEQIAAWDKSIDEDEKIPAYYKNEPIIREIMFSGLWLIGELEKNGCDKVLAIQFQVTHGGMCFGRDPWEQAEILLNSFLKNSYTIES